VVTLSFAVLFDAATVTAGEQVVRAKLAEAPPMPPVRSAFAIDPIADGAILVGSATFAALLNLIDATGEVLPQQISPTFDRTQLLAIDRWAITQAVDPHARMYSNLGLAAAVGYAVLDPIWSGVRERSVLAGLIDATIYAEAIAVTSAVTNLTKLAVRRPRPQAYIDAEASRGDPSYANADTDSALSFFSGHASLTASISATATYLAFVRSPDSPRPWITLGAGAALTTFVSVERVRGGAHFPTDVIAGSFAGATIGVLVAHLHRHEEARPQRVWIGFAPERSGGGCVQASGVF
jgi:membrane-associated phospholipid phosphatase